MPTFSALGVPFLLFEANVKEAVEYAGETACDLCGAT